VDTEALNTVLSDFFQKTEDGWRNSKCDLVVREYHEMADKNRRNGMKGGRPKSNKQEALNPLGSQSDSSGMPMETHSKANQEPITSNHKPKPQKKAPAVLCPAGVEAKVWSDWLEIRKAKNLPLTETAWKQLMVECQKANLTVDAMIKECCLRGWAAFKAAWWERENKESTFKTQGDRNSTVLQGLTRGLVGGGNNVKLLGN
jgi:hypothetical protein